MRRTCSRLWLCDKGQGVLESESLETGLRELLLTPEPARGKGYKPTLQNSMGDLTSSAGMFFVPARFFIESN